MGWQASLGTARPKDQLNERLKGLKEILASCMADNKSND